MNPYWFIQCRLNKGLVKVYHACFPSVDDGEDKHEPYRLPGRHWCKGVEGAFLEITSDAVASLELVDASVREALEAKHPGTR